MFMMVWVAFFVSLLENDGIYALTADIEVVFGLKVRMLASTKLDVVNELNFAKRVRFFFGVILLACAVVHADWFGES